jgi:hypothetical protein
MEKEIVKIRTLKGQIITLEISEKNNTHLFGKDKFGQPVILPIEQIYSMLPISGTQLKLESGGNQSVPPINLKLNGELE